VAVRFSADTDKYTATTGLPGATLTFICWTYLSSDRNNFSTLFNLDCSTGNELWLGTEVDGTTLTLFGSSDGSFDIGATASLTIGTWYQVAIVLNGTSATLYVGAAGSSLTATSTASWPSLGTVTSFTIGGSATTTAELWDGRVANVKIYTAALSQAEVTTELASWTAVRATNLLRHHKLQIPETTDYSGNGNALTAGSTSPTTEGDPPIGPASPSTASAVTYVATSTPTPVGTTTTASTVSITPTLPTGTASGDRVFVIQAGNNTSGTTPTSWTAAGKDVQVGPTGTAPGAGTGRRYLSVYYRDYDGAWTMPAFTLTSAAQNTHAISVITLQKVSGATWDSPTVSTAGNTGSAVTAYSVTTGSLTAPSGMVILGTATNDNVTASAESLTSSAMTFANLAERSDTGSATGNDVSIKSYTADVYSGGTGTITHAATLSAASEGGSIVVAQTSTASGPAFPPRHRGPQYRR
jgi:hypothetical protein